MSFNEWKEYKLKEVADILTGFPFKGNKYSETGVRVLRGENVTIGELRWDMIKCWNDFFEQSEKYSLKNGDVVIGMDGSRVGKNRAQIKNNDLPLLLAQRVARLRAKNKTDQDFLAYVIKAKDFENYISAVQTGTSIPHISQRQIEDFELFLPPLSTQRRIASILSSLDDKIELNRQTNQTLEAIAQTLFKEWFVNFNFPGATGEMIESEMGEIPKGWRVGKLADVCQRITKGTTPTTLGNKFVESGINFLRAECISESTGIDESKALFIDEITHDKLKRSQLQTNDILITIAGSIGRVGLVSNRVLPANTNQAIGIIRVNETLISSNYVYPLLKQKSTQDLLLSGITQSVQANISLSDLNNLSLIIPSNQALLKFNAIINPLRESIDNNINQTQTLIQLRDSLLPKLMKGEIKIN